ncbi:MAG: Gfo/Idh/MocA family oxidoreductase [Oscillospiraceae bacterium]|nr:Gfo/Idh/MocA family oxidoreductase [Oscillospiraceae bacterium]
MSKKLKVGIIGIGNMGGGHATNRLCKEGVCPDMELVAVADTNPERLEWAKEALPESVARFATAQELLDSGLVEACIIATPHYFHPEYAIECMKRGIHVMVEKPAGVYLKQVREMNEIADKYPDVVFGVMFNQRTNHVYRKMRELVQSGKYGEIRRTNWLITNWFRTQFYYDSGSWRATWAGEGGGVLMNQCPHQLDLWQWICGMPVKVQAQVKNGNWHDIEVDDDVTAYVEYANGATGVFITSTGDACGTNRFEIQMDKAKLVVENDKLTVYELEQSATDVIKTSSEAFVSIKTDVFEPETDGLNLQHNGVLNAWAAAILRGEPLVADGKEGINGVAIANAIHLSAWLGKEIELPFDEDLHYEELKKRIATSKTKDNVKAVFADTSKSYAGA